MAHDEHEATFPTATSNNQPPPEEQTPRQHTDKDHDAGRALVSLPPPTRWAFGSDVGARASISIFGINWKRMPHKFRCARLALPGDGSRNRPPTVHEDGVFRLDEIWFGPFGGLIEFPYEYYHLQLGCRKIYPVNHVVIGLVNWNTGHHWEVLVDHIEGVKVNALNARDKGPDKLFASIRKAERDLRPLAVRIFSLKSLAAFSVYECIPDLCHHTPVHLDDQSKAILNELYRDSRSEGRMRQLMDGRWLSWVQEHLNAGDREKGGRHLSLELVMKWDPWKIGIYGLTPVVLSLASGFMFQYLQEGDRVAVIQTAWTISSYITATSGGKPITCDVRNRLSPELSFIAVLLAILAATTQLGN